MTPAWATVKLRKIKTTPDKTKQKQNKNLTTRNMRNIIHNWKKNNQML